MNTGTIQQGKTKMRAIVRQRFGGPEELMIKEIPIPEPEHGQVVIRVKAFGLNHAEIYMRKGDWGDVAKVSGIECVGLVEANPDGQFTAGQKVLALMGGMGRTIDGSYAQYTRVPVTNVVPIQSDLSWEDLAAIPESYATAWTCLHDNLALVTGQTLVIRGATSALGQAALNIASQIGVRVFATTRNPDRVAMLKQLGAQQVHLEGPDLARRIRGLHPERIDAVLELAGNSTILDSLAIVGRGGRVCLAGFLGGLGPIALFNPLLQMPSGVHFSFFGSFMFGQPEFPLSDVPFQQMIDRAATGAYQARPAKVFPLEEIQKAHRLMETNQAKGKLVIRV
jgi:NADPH:quinone reductase and related Zn-dependent oxidoreductases